MKKIIILALFMLSAIPTIADAKVKIAKDEKVTKKQMKEYVCESIGKPRDVWYVDVKPSNLNNGRVILRFGDSKHAHRVRVKLWYSSHGKRHKKTFLTRDNGWLVIDGLKNGKRYSFRLRGESNCGNGAWSKVVRTYP